MSNDDSSIKTRPARNSPAVQELLQKEHDKLNPPVAPVDPATLPHQFTFNEWLKAGAGFGNPKPTGTSSDSCLHDWQIYHGFHFSDIFCTKCSQTRPMDPSQ